MADQAFSTPEVRSAPISGELTIGKKSPINRLHLIHLKHIGNLRKKVENKSAELIERQQKAKAIRRVMQEINNCTDKNGKLDLSQRPDLAEQLKEIKEKYDVNISLKAKYAANELTRLLDNLNFSVHDWDTDSNLDLKKLASLSSEYDQSILMVRSELNTEERASHEITRHIAG